LKAVKNIAKNFEFANDMMVPRLKKVVLSMGLGKIFKNSAEVEKAFNALKVISGQKPIYALAKKSIAGFDVREGMKTGIKVTLRKKMMDDFLTRLSVQALPKLRDYEGFNSKSFNGKSFSYGVKDASKLFSEIIELLGHYDLYIGMNITFVFDKECKEAQKMYMIELGLPFQD